MTSKAELGEAWKDARIPKAQARFVDMDLGKLGRGAPPTVYVIVANALKMIPGEHKLTLLDIGCAAGYYSEAIATLVGDRFDYTGADYSEAMLAAARKRYPGIKLLALDIRHIGLRDGAYDVVLSGAVIIHVEGWKEAVRELARIARSHLILHRTPVTEGETVQEEGKTYKKIRVTDNFFNQGELMNLLMDCGFNKVFEAEIYPLKKGPDHRTYVFERL